MLNAALLLLLSYALPRIAWYFVNAKVPKRNLRLATKVFVAVYALVITYAFSMTDIYLSAAAIVLTLLAVFDEELGWLKSLRKSKKEAEKVVHTASVDEKTWNESDILQISKEIINHYKADLSAKDFTAISHYSTDSFSYKSRLLIEALYAMNRKIKLNFDVLDISIIYARDAFEKEQDEFSLYVTAEQSFKLVDEATNQTIMEHEGDTEEIIKIEREDNQWQLSSVQRAKKGEPILYKGFQDFAHKSGYYYNNEASFMLHPHVPALSFAHMKDAGHAMLGINNNVLATYLMIQSESEAFYTMASLALPGKYPHILIRHRSFTELLTESLQRVKVDWPEFNEYYELFIDDPEAKPLLLSIVTPEFVSYLLKQDEPVSIEYYGRNGYVLFTNEPDYLLACNELLNELHKRSLVSAATRALMETAL